MVCVPFDQVLGVFDSFFSLWSVAIFKVECLELLDPFFNIVLLPIYPFASSSLSGLGKCLGICFCVGVGLAGATASMDVRFVVLSVGYGMF